MRYDTIILSYHFKTQIASACLRQMAHFYDYFHLPITNEAMTLYNGVKDYYIVFIQLKSSNGETIR